MLPEQVLTGARVELRALRASDVTQRYVNWLNDPEVSRYLESRLVNHDLISTEAFVASIAESDSSALFGIFDIAGGVHVGNIKLGPIDALHGSAEIGLMIGDRSAWGKGIGSEAIALICQWAFKVLGLKKLTAGSYAINIGSIKAFEHAGFEIEGRQISQVEITPGVRMDVVLMGKVNEEA
jgi:ribosomal-protein-alanine N-acetyltransferase